MSIVRSEERTPQQLSELLAILQAQGYGQPSLGALMGEYLSLPGLVGFWPGNVRGGSGALNDMSQNGLHLTRNGSTLFTTLGAIPCIFYNGSAYYSHADTTLFDILGNESDVASANRGLFLCGWFRFSNAAGTAEVLAGKYGGAGGRSYILQRNAAGTVSFIVSDNGTDTFTVTSSSSTVANRWYFIAGRFNPSTEIKVWLNQSSASNLTSIPATIFNSASVFDIGAFGSGSVPLSGYACFNALASFAVSNDKVLSLYHMGKRLFGA